MTLQLFKSDPGGWFDHFDDPINIANAHGLFFIFKWDKPESL